METCEIAAGMANGSIIFSGRDVDAGTIEWNEHPVFKGVHLKHLVKGEDTGGKLSCHIVKLNPGCVLEEHVHDSQWELHEVIDGDGSFTLKTKETPYYPGRMALIPLGTSHKVAAGGNGLVILAKFFPALL